MYFWRIERLKAQLVARPFTDREVLPYVVTYGALFSLALALPPENPNGWDTVTGLLGVPLTILGTFWLYRQNGGQAGENFLQRYVAIGWVVLLRLMPGVFAIAMVVYVIKGAPPELPAHTTWLDALVAVALAVAYYQRVGTHLRHVARQSESAAHE